MEQIVSDRFLKSPEKDSFLLVFIAAGCESKGTALASLRIAATRREPYSHSNTLHVYTKESNVL